MQCPACRAAMQRLTLEGRLRSRVDIDVCTACRGFWFDPFETIHLTAASTSTLFALIHEHAGGGEFPSDAHCPECGARLVLTHDRQRNTPFQYWRCPDEHGRFTSFADFLREKDFVRTVTQSEAVQMSVRSVNCANCGAPVDLGETSTCAHCGTEVAVFA